LCNRVASVILSIKLGPGLAVSLQIALRFVIFVAEELGIKIMHAKIIMERRNTHENSTVHADFQSENVVENDLACRVHHHNDVKELVHGETKLTACGFRSSVPPIKKVFFRENPYHDA
jgi:hypothetical protein